MTPGTPLWRGMDRATLDREYNARDTVLSFEAELHRYQTLSAQARATLPHTPGLVFDPPTGTALDWFHGHPGGPVLLWIHGGYWRALSRADNSCVAPGLVAAGIHVAVIDYSLAPAASLDTIAAQVRTAVGWVHARAQAHGADPARLFVGGSSAGAHLAALVATNPPAPVQGALCLSGLFELEPIRLSHINAWLHLDEPATHRLSPQRHIPAPPAPRLFASAGGLETAEFKRQTADFAAAWQAAGNEALVFPAEFRHHFDIVPALGAAHDPLCQAARSFLLAPSRTPPLPMPQA